MALTIHSAYSVTYGDSTSNLYKCELSTTPWPEPNMAANPCASYTDADSCNAVDTCNFVGGACYEHFEQNGFKCTLTPSMLSDIHSNTQYNPTSLDNGNPMYGKQCTDAATCPNYDCVVGDKCTNPTQLEIAQQACASNSDGGCCQVPPPAGQVDQDGVGAAYTQFFGNAVTKYLNGPTSCDVCSARKGEADCTSSKYCVWEDGVCSANGCPLGCELKTVGQVPAGNVQTIVCPPGHKCSATYGKCENVGENIGPHAVLNGDEGRVKPQEVCWIDIAPDAPVACTASSDETWSCVNGKALCRSGHMWTPGDGDKCSTLIEPGHYATNCYLNEPCESRTCNDGDIPNHRRDACIKPSEATYQEKISDGWPSQMCFQSGSDYRDGCYCQPPVADSSRLGAQCPTTDREYLFYSKAVFGCTDTQWSSPPAQSQQTFCNVFNTTADNYVCPNFSPEYIQQQVDAAQNLYDSVSGLDDDFVDSVRNLYTECNGTKPTYDQRVLFGKLAVMHAAQKNGESFTVPHDVDPSSSHYGCRYPYTFPCDGNAPGGGLVAADWTNVAATVVGAFF